MSKGIAACALIICIAASSPAAITEPGKFSDLVAVAADPVVNVTELERVQFVMKKAKSSGTIWVSDRTSLWRSE